MMKIILILLMALVFSGCVVLDTATDFMSEDEKISPCYCHCEYDSHDNKEKGN